jgi:hypothetical protein
LRGALAAQNCCWSDIAHVGHKIINIKVRRDLPINNRASESRSGSLPRRDGKSARREPVAYFVTGDVFLSF